MFKQQQVDWLGVLLAGMMIAAGVSAIIYLIVVFFALSPTNLGGYGLYIFVGLGICGGLALIGLGVKFVALSWAGGDVA